MQGKIIKGIGGFYYVHDGIGKVYECRAKGIFRNRGIKPLVGDDVEISVLDEEKATGNLDEILPRKNRLIRPAVSNVDQAVVVFAITDPMPNLNLLDRFLVMMERQEVPVSICFNKIDLVDAAEQEKLRAIYEPAGYPVHFIKLKRQAEEVNLFSDDEVEEGTQPISHEDYERLIKYLEKKNPPAILPIQIAYYAGLRIGETCGLTWQDINLEEQCLTIKRSIRYDGMKHKNIIGPTKRKKVRIVDFGDTLTEILKSARKEQLKNRMQYGELYHRNYYKEVHVKNRVYYEYYHLDGTQEVPADYKKISFVCLRPDGSLELPSTLGIVCRSVSKRLDGFEDFHFHQLRHTYTSNLLSNGAAPKDVQELLGHSDVSTTMNIYAHSTRKAKRDSARLLDKVASNA